MNAGIVELSADEAESCLADLCALLLDQLNECVTVVGFVGNHALGLFTDQ